ncbi:MAG TPA: electron transfer flavoprotein subunit alpha/FixB family protein [Anaerolineales bacterium]|nr:electron transfer flavoprotein subunit alpha/FixB family protein [Anaerolineales bacterium]
MNSQAILVFSEDADLLKELVSGAKQGTKAQDWRIAAVGVGKEASALANLGEDVLYQVDVDVHNPELLTAALEAAARKVEPSIVLVGATKLGLEVAPRIAERLAAGYAAWATGFEVASGTEGAKVMAQSMIFAGVGIATHTFKAGPVVLSVARGIFDSRQVDGKQAEVVVLDTPLPAPKLTIHGYRPKAMNGGRLAQARFVVDVGQGVKERDDLQITQALANLLDGQLSCSRPMSADRDWFPEWVGLSGAKIKPELCVTVGVSGAVQHIIGIRDSHLIVAVNMDEGAPIFSQADYGVVADLYEFLPLLIERISARGIRPAWAT